MSFSTVLLFALILGVALYFGAPADPDPEEDYE